MSGADAMTGGPADYDFARTTAHGREPGATLPTSTVDRLRIRGVVIVAALGWATLGVLLVAALFLENGSATALLATGALVNLAPTAVALRRRYDAEARAIVGTLAAVMPVLLVYSLRGHPWQMDGHMYFFVALAVLTLLCDWKPIAIASGLIAAHHLLLEWFAPEWVFAGTGNIGRVVFHAVAVVLQLGILSYVTLRLERLLDSQDAAVEDGRRLVDAAEAERRRAGDALASARSAETAAAEERGRREALEQRLAVERNAELRTFAEEFERTVATVVKSIEGAAAQLAGSSSYLSDIAGEAGRQADDVATSAAEATGEIRQVALSLTSLATSISTIAVTAHQQDASAKAAHEEGRRSVGTITGLFDQAGKISSFVATIKGIAAKTNMLALNASIEAARAGETGRGFAVVAGEVKSLAGEAARASDEIAHLLQGVHGAVAESAAGVESVTAGVRQVSEAAGGIAVAVADQRGYAAEIEDSASRAASSADAIEHRIGRVASAVTVASTLSVEVRKSAGALLADAGELRSMTDRFVQFFREDQ